MSGRARNWCITINAKDEVDTIEAFLVAGPTTRQISTKLRYMVWQFEECPTTFRTHVQMYAEFLEPFRMNAVKEMLGCPSAHLEQRRGTRNQARDYCMKEESRIAGPYELGVWELDPNGNQGKRTDLDELASRVAAGDSLLDVAEHSPATYIRNYRGIQNYKFLIDQQAAREKFREVETVVITGPSGVGKTRSVFDYCKMHNYSLFKLDMGENLWFDGYAGEEVLLLDDFYGGIKYHVILNMLDVYPYRCPIKGGHIWANWKMVFITSNKVPAAWYKQGLTDALERRLTYWLIMVSRFGAMQNGWEGPNFPTKKQELFPLHHLPAAMDLEEEPPIPDAAEEEADLVMGEIFTDNASEEY